MFALSVPRSSFRGLGLLANLFKADGSLRLQSLGELLQAISQHSTTASLSIEARTLIVQYLPSSPQELLRCNHGHLTLSLINNFVETELDELLLI